jgi:hypothetical protein
VPPTVRSRDTNYDRRRNWVVEVRIIERENGGCFSVLGHGKLGHERDFYGPIGLARKWKWISMGVVSESKAQVVKGYKRATEAWFLLSRNIVGLNSKLNSRCDNSLQRC